MTHKKVSKIKVLNCAPIN